MHKNTIISADMKMADIIHIDLYNLFIINRFGIRLGFGDKTIKEVCEKENVDHRLFTTVCNINNSTTNISKTDIHTEHILQLVEFLKNSRISIAMLPATALPCLLFSSLISTLPLSSAPVSEL